MISIKRVLGKASFNFSWLLARPLFRFFLHYKVENPEKLKALEPPLIIISNHISYLDPFLIGAAFPLGAKVFPIRFATDPQYYRSPFLFPFIWLLAGFPIYKKIGLEESLKVPLEVLKKKGVVGIFPQGKIRRYGRPRKGRRGAAYLARKTGSPILPIRIEGRINIGLKRFFSREAEITVIVGELFRLPRELSRGESMADIDRARDFIIKRMQEHGIH